MQQLVLLTGLSEYALKGDGQDYSMPPFTLPQLAFRSSYPVIEYENGQMGHRITIQGNRDWPEHWRYCNMNGNYEFPESLFAWTSVARDVVTVPDDTVLSDWGQYLPRDGGAEITGAWVDEKPIESAAKMLEARAEVAARRQAIEWAENWMAEHIDGLCCNHFDPWVLKDEDGIEVLELADFFDRQEATILSNLFSAALPLYTALKLALAELNEYTNGVDETEAPSLFHAIRTAKSALAKAVGKGVEND